MKKKTTQPTRSKFSILCQLCNLIPRHLVPRVAKETGVHLKARTFTAWSHLVSMMYLQLTRSISLNDLCDGLNLNRAELETIRGARPPSRNGLSHANKNRDAGFAERVFWEVMAHLQSLTPDFVRGRNRPVRRFRRAIHAIDSTTIKLVMSCFDWAKHRRRKAAAKLHVRLNLQSFLPGFVCIGKGSGHDVRYLNRLCNGLKSGEIAVFDMAYVAFEPLNELTQRDVFWVSRVRKNQEFRVVKKRITKANGSILRDDVIRLTGVKSGKLYPRTLRRVRARVEVGGKLVEMEFLTNNFDWSPSSIADLYKSRWSIEVFFRNIKQTLQLSDFVGYSENAVRWQIWTALLVYMLLSYLSFCSGWKKGFVRIWAITRSILWRKLDLFKLLKSYGTAPVPLKLRVALDQAYLPGF